MSVRYMNIKIKSCENEELWYKNSIGETCVAVESSAKPSTFCTLVSVDKHGIPRLTGRIIYAQDFEFLSIYEVPETHQRLAYRVKRDGLFVHGEECSIIWDEEQPGEPKALLLLGMFRCFMEQCLTIAKARQAQNDQFKNLLDGYTKEVFKLGRELEENKIINVGVPESDTIQIEKAELQELAAFAKASVQDYFEVQEQVLGQLRVEEVFTRGVQEQLEKTADEADKKIDALLGKYGVAL